MADPPILLVGASTRAAAWSALRAGLAPLAIDRFIDLDLSSIAQTQPAGDWATDSSVLSAADLLPAAPWLYTGPIENRPGLVDLLSRRRNLWGNPPDVLQAIRDPIPVTETLRAAGLPGTEARICSACVPTDGSWLLKPRASGGGYGIVPWTGQGAPGTEAHYFQKFVPGRSHAAIFTADGHAARLLGITLQLVGGGGSRFGYRGSIGPLTAPRGVCETLERIASTLAARFGLRGLLGIDYIDREGIPVPIEVNPRYSASVEILELTSGIPFLSTHRLSFDRVAGSEVSRSPATEPVLGKRILFARHALRVPDNPPWAYDSPDPWKIPAVADLPHPGTTFAPGEPVLTVFAPGNDPTDCRRNLDAAAGRWTRAFGNWTI